jgi:hypothetical protein
MFSRLRNKLFMKLITLISFSDFIANIAMIGGVPGQHDLCVLQGLAQQFFYPASWIWTVILTYLLYSLVVYGKISLPEWKMHLITWGLCLTITLLPLTTSTYGGKGDDHWCWLQTSKRHHSGGRSSRNIWVYLTFDCVIFGCFFLMILWAVLIYHKLRIQQIPATKTVISALRALLQYPAVFFFTWFPLAILLGGFAVHDDLSSTPMIVCDALSIWQGGFTAIVFFYNSQESRTLWYNFFMNRCCCCCCGGGGGSIGFAEQDIEKARLTYANNDHFEEDFESDDAYYGRTTNDLRQSLPSSSTSIAAVDSNIALSELRPKF